MPQFLRDHHAIAPGINHWLTNDKRFKAAGLTATDVTAVKDADLTLATLAETIVGQQLSTKAAATIWARVQGAVGRINNPSAWAAFSDDDLRALGLSRPKIIYIRGLSTAVQTGQVNLRRLKTASNDDVIAALTSLKGFGLWSAQMILIFTLARPDVWPSGDLGIQDGVRLYRDLPERPSAPDVARYGARRFGPHLSAAALLLWRLKDKK